MNKLGKSKKFYEREVFIEWFATPTEEREPKTQEELEKRLKISDGRSSKWLKESDFADRVIARVREKAKIAHSSSIASATMREALHGNQQAVANYYKYIEQTAEKSEHKITGKVSDILSEEDDKGSKED